MEMLNITSASLPALNLADQYVITWLITTIFIFCLEIFYRGFTFNLTLNGRLFSLEQKGKILIMIISTLALIIFNFIWFEIGVILIFILAFLLVVRIANERSQALIAEFESRRNRAHRNEQPDQPPAAPHEPTPTRFEDLE